ncbi:MAG: urea ABC transporter ATP-binding protein UrtD [Myxococcota bacterium]|jgi:urea transport system ATP-binding protein|nr:urea ABC transporter ATP-binding protein UrtD [Myxococcota bacterium]
MSATESAPLNAAVEEPIEPARPAPRAEAETKGPADKAPDSPRKGRSPRISWLPKKRTVDQSRVDELTHGRKALLCVDSVSVSFDGFRALDNLTLVLDEGELRCIIGPNGAGKTTLQDVITGKTKPDSGSVFLIGDDQDLTQLREDEIAQRGVCRKFQRPTVFQGHSVFENLELTLPGKKRVFSSLFARLTRTEREKIERVLEIIGLKDEAQKRAGLLSHGQKQWLEIGMLLSQEPRVLLVDEPVAGMTHRETEKTAELLNSLAGDHTVVVVEHDMEFVRSIAKTVTVLHEGRVLAEGSMDAVQADPKVIEVYLGGADA